jgi:hypothetical protein
MKYCERAIRQHLDICLDPSSTRLGGFLKCHAGIFRIGFTGTPVRTDKG